MLSIETKKLTKKYKDLTAVNELDLKINKGELFSLLGINGAGKTTTIKMLSCLTKPTSGDAFLNGKSIVSNSNDVKKIIGVSPQETAIAPNLTVKENLLFVSRLYGLSKPEREKKAEEFIEKFALTAHKNKKAGKLSGGFKRRLSIAMALIGEPEILFLDEPTLGLDVIARSELWDLILSLKGKITIILTTHYMEEAERLSDRIAIMKNSNLLCVDTAENIKKLTGEEKFEDAFISVIKEAKQ